MIYLSAEYILHAIQLLAPVHSFMGITYLTCKKIGLPVGSSINFSMDSQTKDFMERVHKIYPGSEYYFQPFETIKAKQWVTPRYPSTGLQSLNTRTFKDAFIHDRGGKQWGWTKDYIEKLPSLVHPKFEKIPLIAIAVWTQKEMEWEDTASIDDVCQKFITDYHISEDEMQCFFYNDEDYPPCPAFQNEPYTWNQLAGALTSPPDALPDKAGTLAKLELNNVGPTDHISLEFAQRLNIITGDNGLGKTFLIDCAWWALTNSWTGNIARPKYAEGRKKASIGFSIGGINKNQTEQMILYDNKNLNWKRAESSSTIPGLLIYGLVDGSYAVWDPSKNYGIGANQRTSVFSRQQIWNGFDGQIEGLIRDWCKWQNAPDKYPFEVFKEVLKVMSPPDLGIIEPDIPVRIPNESKEIPTIAFPYGIVPITNASAGVQRVLTLSYLIVWAWYEHKENCKLRKMTPDSRMVILIDELEAHLHPKWQRTILPALMQVQKILSDELQIQFIVATHSPLIMASAETLFDDEVDQLYQIKLDKDQHNAILETEEFIQYGQVNAWLTSPIFNLNQARSTDAERAINAAKHLQLQEEPDNHEVQQVHNELVRCLAQNDAFWPRWIYFAEEHGVVL